MVKVLRWLPIPKGSEELQLLPLAYKPVPLTPTYCLVPPAAASLSSDHESGAHALPKTFVPQGLCTSFCCLEYPAFAWLIFFILQFKCFHIMKIFLQTIQITLALFYFTALTSCKITLLFSLFAYLFIFFSEP